MRDTLLVIEDEDLLGGELVRHFQRCEWHVVRACKFSQAHSMLFEDRLTPLVVLSDMSLPDGNALDLLEQARQHGVLSEWVLLSGYGTIPDSVRALRLGAADFLEKPCDLERLDLVVAGAARSARAQRRLHEQSAQQHGRYRLDAFVGSDARTREVRELLARLFRVPITGLVIGGETGTGKGLVARILHYNGSRRQGPLVEINCAALPTELLESELFGHEAGAFTGAKGRHRGLLEQAQGGTVFLDEVGDMGLGLQAKLLKAIEDRRIRRLGAERESSIDFQVFAASNRDLAEEVVAGRFRPDLYHRLSVLRIDLPPLRERIVDLSELVPLFIAEYNAVAAKSVQHVSDSTWQRLRSYPWPGNVRELRNVIERCVLLSDGPELQERWLDTSDLGANMQRQDRLVIPLDGSLSLDGVERQVIRAALERCSHNVTAAARMLRTTRQTLRYRIDKYGL